MKKSKEEKDKKQHCDECENPDINVDENLEEVSSNNDNLCDQSEEEILILKNNIENLEEKIKLTQAELINYRKRKDEETSNMLKYANMDLIVELLPVLDNFERALNMKSEFKDIQKVISYYIII